MAKRLQLVGGLGDNSGSVQPDWNQNDSTKPDYVKNRPFCDTRRYVTTPETTVTGDVVEWGCVKCSDKIDFDITKVQFVSCHSSEGFEMSDEPVIMCNEYGNAIDLVSHRSDDYLFTYLPTQEDADEWAGYSDGNPFSPGLYVHTDHDNGETVSITYSFKCLMDGDLQTLDPKYFPEGGVGYSYLSDEVILFDGTIEIPDGSVWNEVQGYPINFMVVNGETYDVVFDGVEYECVASKGYFGSADLWNGTGNYDSTQPPFAYGDGWFAAAESGSHTVVIRGKTRVDVPIEMRYIPKDLMCDIDDLFNHMEGLYSTANNAQTAANNAQTAANNSIETLTIKSMNGNVATINESTTLDNGKIFILRNTSYTSTSRDVAKLKIGSSTCVVYTINPDRDATSYIDLNNPAVAITFFRNDFYPILQYISSQRFVWLNKFETSKFVENGDSSIILTSSTTNSTKKFNITVDDSGTLAATEVTN